MTSQTDREELIERIEKSQDMIGEMCKEGRCPKMSIPVQKYDEDIFISDTLNQCKDYLSTPLPDDVAEMVNRMKTEPMAADEIAQAADMLERLGRDSAMWEKAAHYWKRNYNDQQQRIEELENICRLGARMRQTPIVDDDFPEVRDAFDLAMKARGFYDD